MELNDLVYKKIVKLSEQGDELADISNMIKQFSNMSKR